MAKIILLSDSSSHGGAMITASGSFNTDGKRVCVNGDLHQCSIHGHGTTPILSLGILKSNGQSVSKIGDIVGCGAVLNTSSSSVTIE